MAFFLAGGSFFYIYFSIKYSPYGLAWISGKRQKREPEQRA
jgi:hypothetical protein